jgi:hypothetical protein
VQAVDMQLCGMDRKLLRKTVKYNKSMVTVWEGLKYLDAVLGTRFGFVALYRHMNNFFARFGWKFRIIGSWEMSTICLGLKKQIRAFWA